MPKNSRLDLFLDAMRGRRLLHLGHKGADCDAVGSAFAMSCLLPGDVGFAEGLKGPAQDLAVWLGLKAQIDPDPSAYDYVLIYDTINLNVLGLPLPDRYALFDHHEPGGHRFADFRSELADGAEWAFVRPVESTCSLLVDLFAEHDVPIDPQMALAMAAGIITDTVWLQQADAAALRRLAVVLEVADLHVEDVIAVIDGPDRKADRRPVVLAALKNVQELESGGWSILATQIDSLDHGLVVTDTLKQLADVSVIGFPHGNRSMVMTECGAAVVNQTGIDMAGLMKTLANELVTEETWGTKLFGRIVADVPVHQLVAWSVDRIAEVLSPTKQ